MKEILLKPIGIIHSPFQTTEGVPIQPLAAKGIEGYIEIFDEYVEGLKDLDGFSHIHLIFNFHKSVDYKLTVTPYLDTQTHGVFATRAPKRPNQIGLSTVRIKNIRENIVTVEDIDIVDGAPLLDIKPYVPMFDQRNNVKTGWLTKNSNEIAKTKDDGRFNF